jgi:predicted acyltransferase
MASKNMTRTAVAPTSRILSLDILRGITIAFMIMVNNNGGSGAWWFMNHAEWNGLTPTDLVFPTFLFVIGVSIVYAFEARLAKGATKPELVKHTLQRTAILIVLGIIVNSFPLFHLEHMRFFGVLQRLGICYCVVGLFYLYDKRVSTKVYALVGCLVAYWILMTFVPVPGYGVPGSRPDNVLLDPNHNLVNVIDQHIFPYHLYEDWTTHNLRDPEGGLSTLPAFGTALLGLLTGIWLRSARAVKQKALGLVVASVSCLASGYLWSICFPLNKKLWTSSYTLVAAGYSLALFALIYFAVEVLNWRKIWSWPWLVLGSNAIVAYMFSELVPSLLYLIQIKSNGKPDGLLSVINRWYYSVIPDPGWAAFSFCLSILAMCFIPVWILYVKKIFVKV